MTAFTLTRCVAAARARRLAFLVGDGGGSDAAMFLRQLAMADGRAEISRRGGASLITRWRGKRACRWFDAEKCGHVGHHVTSRLAERS